MEQDKLIQQTRELCDAEFNKGSVSATLMRSVFKLTDAFGEAQKEIERLKTQCDINATSFLK